MYKLLDNIILVCRDEDHYKSTDAMQAYLVDPSNKNQLESARRWAAWTEYGPSVKTESGKWEREWTKKHEPIEHIFGNQHFRLELLDCAGGSSQGGKLSFWNCIVSKDDKRFKIGINSDMLLELLKNATFIKGKCQDDLLFVTDNGRVGMCAEGSQVHRDAIKDMELKAAIKSNSVSKFEFGDILKTTMLHEVYLGTMTRYYTFDPGNNVRRYTNYYDFRDCTLTKLAKPVKYHVFDSISTQTKLSNFSDYYGASRYAYPDFKKSCPKRTIDGKIDLDISQEEFYKRVVNKIYDFDAYLDYCKQSYSCPKNEDTALYYFLGSSVFGFGTEPFEIPEDVMRRLKAAGMKYVEE